ncbi:MAG: AAA family ATPase [Victivallales bacterium]|nr:AAA family ATPase [Victivallales bacterium]
MQQITIDSSDFPKLRSKCVVYVDKTAYLHRLLTSANDCFFIARPRRFGKSLMISTLKAIFEGHRELFDGLAISKTDWAWEKHPVLYFNLGFAASSSPGDFRQLFHDAVSAAITNAGGNYDDTKLPASNFGCAIDSLSKTSNGKGVVILIDEYDDPVAQLLHRPDDAEAIRGTLADFYRQMKDRTGKIRFLMITGVSKFTKMSVFSALSNLVDLSFDDGCATMLGYTEAELDQYFGEHMRAHAAKMGLSDADYRAELKRWFNGYRFGKYSTETVYNPVSIGKNLSGLEKYFTNYWSSTGKAAMLMNFLKREEFLGVDMDNVTDVDESDFDVTDIRALRTVPMLFQTGYLTIADYEPFSQTYTLCVPDVEVRQDLATLTTAVAAGQDISWVTSLGKKLLRTRWNEFFDGLRALYAALPYGPSEKRVQEFSYERMLLTLLWSQAIKCTVEDRQANGQADVVAIHPCGVFIFELKVGESAESALRQVRAKQYDAPYRAKGLPIWLIGLNFNRETRQLVDTLAEKA